MAFKNLSEHEEEIGIEIGNAVYTVHSNLGRGCLKVYEGCITYVLRKKGLGVARQIEVPIHYH